MRTLVIVSVVGPDRPGLVEGLSSAIAAAGGNWEGSRMLRLGGQFAGMVQVALEEPAEAALERLASALGELDRAGLRTALHRAGVGSEASTEGGGRSYELEVVGQDRQGIVSAISGLLARLGVNVVELATDCEAAPWSGERHFRTRALLHCGEEPGEAELREAVEAIAIDLAVELRTTGG
jgi:glycine cleavage system regulatory protein